MSPLLLHGREMGVCKGAENNQNAHTRIRSFLLEKMSDMNVTHAKPGMLFVVSLYNSSMASARVRDNHIRPHQAPFALAPMTSRWFYVASLALPLSISTVSQSPPEALPMPMVIQERGRRRFRSSSLQQWFPGPLLHILLHIRVHLSHFSISTLSPTRQL